MIRSLPVSLFPVILVAAALAGCASLSPLRAASVGLAAGEVYVRADEVASIIRRLELHPGDRGEVIAAVESLEQIRSEIRQLVTDPTIASARLTLDARAWYVEAKRQIRELELALDPYVPTIRSEDLQALRDYRRELRVLGAGVLDALEAGDRSELWRQWQAWTAIAVRAYELRRGR